MTSTSHTRRERVASAAVFATPFAVAAATIAFAGLAGFWTLPAAMIVAASAAAHRAHSGFAATCLVGLGIALASSSVFVLYLTVWRPE
ncbi:MAG TPA: hypothetical protein VGM80_17430 [Gaiellaceae bacterium]|jgi:hypothetical protein